MNKIMMHMTGLLLLAGMWVPQTAMAVATGNIDTVSKYAWSENSGWQNYRPTHGGVTVNATFLAGFVWAENIGFIELGNSVGGPYSNTTSTNWGVNRDNTGKLTGYAWSETAGWINFNPTHSQVTISTVDGTFSGYAWAENVGWIHFKAGAPAYNVATPFIPDTTPPVITRVGANPVTIAQGSTYTDAGATATDTVDGTLTGSITVSNPVPNPATVGVFTVTYDVSDAAGNAATQVTRTVNVTDQSAPVITLTGSDPVTLLAGASYTDAGATATDTVDGNLSGSITVSNPVPNPVTEGVFTVTYDVSDAAGNAATQLTRTVKVAAAAATTTTTAGDTVQLTLSDGTSTVDIVSNGEVVFGVSSATPTGNLPANTSFPFGIIDYQTSVATKGSSKTVRLIFSAALPANMVLYKVDNAGNYTKLPTSIWTKIDANTLDLTLTDGDATTDLDGTADGMIHDPLAIGSPAPASSGGCTLHPTSNPFDPVLPVLSMLFIISAWRRKRQE